MVTAQVSTPKADTIEIWARFESDGMIGDGQFEVSPLSPVFDIPYPVWLAEAGQFVQVEEDGTLTRLKTRI